MIKIGMMIGDRYEILEKIGTGGMSDVYKAKCHKLNRFVAIKVLKQEFSENANFVSKFRIEAQAAAGLMHPNIVNIYDVGEENGIYFIVMELVDGITLKKYIEKKARLSYKEAVSISIQVSLGIQAAHNNHIIHRDIKPQNIMISKDGKVKVTDFGIAKAATSNTITSNVMGSVHYTSPEQARGGYSDEKSDIYSLGITLFEMLTGRVPFNGETTVAIAIKHIQEPLPSPRDYVGEIPISVEQIVFKCCQKSPDRRYQSMSELVEDLKQSLMNPDEVFVKMVNVDEEASTKMISDADLNHIKRESGREGMRETMRLRSETMPLPEDVGEEAEYDEDYDPKMEKITTILAVVAGIIICIIIIILAGKIFGLFNTGQQIPINPDNQQESENNQEQQATEETVEMIAVAGMSVDEAKSKLLQLRLNPEVTYVESDTQGAGVVISADVEAGKQVAVNTTVTLTVSSGTESVEVPQITGMTYEDALSALEQKGFVANKTEGYSDDVEAGKVISQNPEAGSKAPKGSSVTVRVSQGKEEKKVRVPNVVGLSEMDATIELTEAGLTVGSVTKIYNTEIAADLVCYQSYSLGSYVEEGTKIDLKISLGEEKITYSYVGSIVGPTIEEDPNFKTGTLVTLSIVTEDGTQLLNTQTATFPVTVNYTNIAAKRGTVTMSYVSIGESVTTEDPVTGDSIVIPGVEEEKIITREVEFTQE